MDIKPHIPDPSVGIPDSLFLKSLAQNDYNIDGKYLSDGQRLCAIADEIGSLQIRYDELWDRFKRLVQMADEQAEEIKELQAKVSSLSLDAIQRLDDEIADRR